MCGDKKASSDNAGAIRAAGGGFAKLEIAHEEEYFYKQASDEVVIVKLWRSKLWVIPMKNISFPSPQRQQQLLDLKNKKLNEEQFRNDAIKSHEDAIQRHKEAISKIRK